MLVDEPVQDGGGGDRATSRADDARGGRGCVAVGYQVWGARLGVAIDDVEVDVICELDARGQLGLADGVSPGWQRITFDIRITSTAPEADVRRVVETADRLSPMLANLSPAIERVHKLRIVGTRRHATRAWTRDHGRAGVSTGAALRMGRGDRRLRPGLGAADRTPDAAVCGTGAAQRGRAGAGCGDGYGGWRVRRGRGRRPVRAR